MASNGIELEKLKGYKHIVKKLKEINPAISIDSAYEVPERLMYGIWLSANSRKCKVTFSRSFLDDLNDFTGNENSEYWKQMESALVSTILPQIEKYGLIPYSKGKLKELLFEHVKKSLQKAQHINKFNLIGRPYQEGSLENYLGVKFTDEERANAGSAFNELKSQGVLIPTYSDLINPEDWVKISDSKASNQGKVLEVDEIDKKEDVKIGDLKNVEKIPIESIFLSSTVENLRDCRAEVVNELQNKGIKVLHSESPEFAGIPRNNVYDICLQNVLSSSHFIIILDRRYGDLYQGTHYERFKDISITHAEFKLALEDKDKPVFFYVRNYVWHHYETWIDNPKLKCDIDGGIFEIIKEFNETKQYITHFDTSVNLKAMILRRIGIS